MKNFSKYKRHYFVPENCTNDWCKNEYIIKAPVWCSVDLRDGNQALECPMDLERKVDFFCMLVKLGFKEIEVGFPASSNTEYEFLRTLIDERLIPDDVTVQVLTQAREHIIKRTFEALDGVKKAIVHLYNSIAPVQREQVFRKSKDEILQLSVDGAKMLKKYANEYEGNFTFEYSPENFSETEPEFARDVCNAIIDVWQPTKDKKAIINLPSTVAVSLPHIFASQVEYMCKNLKDRENVIVSLHSHNDRGCAVADTELGLLAGADRVEGTLFGNGERTGNCDIVTLALNMYSHGVDPKLNLENIPEIAEKFEQSTAMKISDRHPYSGKLVFAAFSGSHQNAIAKSMAWIKQNKSETWNVPYLPIDPSDIGREYENDIIRINSQSGGGGIGYILKNKFAIDLPKEFQVVYSRFVKNWSDNLHREFSPREIYDLFAKNYVNLDSIIKLIDFHITREDDNFKVQLSIVHNGKNIEISGEGNGRLDAVSNAIKKHFGIVYSLFLYTEHALQRGSTSEAISYVGISMKDNKFFGAGIHNDIITSSVLALFSALNLALAEN